MTDWKTKGWELTETGILFLEAANLSDLWTDKLTSRRVLKERVLAMIDHSPGKTYSQLIKEPALHMEGLNYEEGCREILNALIDLKSTKHIEEVRGVSSVVLNTKDESEYPYRPGIVEMGGPLGMDPNRYVPYDEGPFVEYEGEDPKLFRNES